MLMCVYLIYERFKAFSTPHPFEASKSENMSYLGHTHLFSFEKWCYKRDHFFGAIAYQIETSRGARGLMCPLLFGGLKGVRRPPHLQERFGLVRGYRWL
jgi:hypothetical protein